MRKAVSLGLIILSLALVGMGVFWDLARGQQLSIGLRQAALILIGLVFLFVFFVVNNKRLSTHLSGFLKSSGEVLKLLFLPSKNGSGQSEQKKEIQTIYKQNLRTGGIIAIAVICLASVAVLGLSAPISTYRFPWNDSSVFAYVGRQVLHGKVLYSQVFDHKPPLIYLINALGLFLGRNSFWGVWLIEVVSLSVSSILIFKLNKKMFGIMPAFIAITVGLFSLVIPLERGNLTEEYAILYQALALFLFLSTLSADKVGLKFFFVGLFGGIAFLFKTNIIGLWIAIGIFLLLRGAKKNFSKMLFMLAGFIAINLVIVLFFAMQGNLQDYWLAVYLYNFFYSDSKIGNLGNIIVQTVNTFIRLSPLYLIAITTWVYLLIKFIYKSVNNGFRNILAGNIYSFYFLIMIYFPIELFLANITSKNFPHYYVAAWIGSVVLFALMVKDLTDWVYLRKLKIAYSIPIILLIVTSISPLKSLYKSYPVLVERTIIPTVQFIDSHTTPKDKIFVFGGQPIVYFQSNRESPSRIFYFNHLAISRFATSAIIDGFIGEFMQDPPKIIVETWGLNSPGIKKNSSGVCTYTHFVQNPSLDNLYDFICSNYEIVQTVGKDGWLIYLRTY